MYIMPNWLLCYSLGIYYVVRYNTYDSKLLIQFSYFQHICTINQSHSKSQILEFNHLPTKFSIKQTTCTAKFTFVWSLSTRKLLQWIFHLFGLNSLNSRLNDILHSSTLLLLINVKYFSFEATVTKFHFGTKLSIYRKESSAIAHDLRYLSAKITNDTLVILTLNKNLPNGIRN